MERYSATEHPVHDLIHRRWSPRAFADRPVEAATLLSVMEAARWAPSCFNEQPWSFLVATKNEPDEYAKLLSCLVEKNQQWARTAPVLMISVASLQFAANGKPNRHSFHDVGLASGAMIFQAMDLGLYTHLMAGFSVDLARSLFQIPVTAEPVAAIAMGYPIDPAELSEEARLRELTPGKRKAMRAFVFSGRWGQAASWV